MKRREFQDGMCKGVSSAVSLVMCVVPAVGTEEDAEDEEKADVIINIKELDDVLIKDVGNHIASSNK